MHDVQTTRDPVALAAPSLVRDIDSAHVYYWLWIRSLARPVITSFDSLACGLAVLCESRDVWQAEADEFCSGRDWPPSDLEALEVTLPDAMSHARAMPSDIRLVDGTMVSRVVGLELSNADGSASFYVL